MPTITAHFHSSTDIGWISSAYSLTGCAVQLPLGRFYKFYPPKWVYVALLGVFVVGSAIGAAAQNVNTIIVGRAIQGIGLGGVFSGATIIVAQNAPLRRRPVFLGILIAMMNIGACIGPLIGGALTSNASWRWCFLINIPIALFVMLVMSFLVRTKPGRDAARVRSLSWSDRILRLDPLGAALFLPAVVCLLLALEWAGATYAWANWRIILLFVLGGLLAIAWALSQALRPEVAALPFRIARQRTVLSSFFFQLLTGGCMLVVTYWLSIWFQALADVSALESGIRTIALVLSQALGAVLGGGLAQLVGYPSPVMMASAVLASLGSGLLATLTPAAPERHWLGYQVLVGLGLGLGTQQASLSVQTVVAEADLPAAIPLIFFGMQFGGSVFVCIAQNVFNQDLSRLLGDGTAIPGVTAATVLATGVTEIRDLVHNAADLQKLLTIYNKSITDTFFVAAAASGTALLAALFVQWNSVKGLKPRMD